MGLRIQEKQPRKEDRYISNNQRMTNQEADISMKKALTAMRGISEDEPENEEIENQSLLAIKQEDKYEFLALVAVTEEADKEITFQAQDTIHALMAGLDSEEEEEDQNSQVSSTFSKENLEIYTKRELKSLLETVIRYISQAAMKKNY